MSPIALADTFSDVGKDHPYYAAIESLVNLKIIKGYADNTFRSDNSVTRAEALKMTMTGASIAVPELTTTDTISFPDVLKSSWFARYVVTGKKLGLVKGNADGTFAPDRRVSKAEFLKMMLSAFKIDLSRHQNLTQNIAKDTVLGQWYMPYLSYAKTIGVISPTLEGNLYPSSNLNRGECAELLYKMLIVLKGGDAQKLLSMAESNLVDLLVDLNNNDIAGALNHADSAIFYSGKTLEIKLNDNDMKIVQGASKISYGFKAICLAYQAGVNKDYDGVRKYVAEANKLALEAYELNAQFAGLQKKIGDVGKVLLGQIE